MTPPMVERVARAIEQAPRADWRRNKANDPQNEFEVYVFHIGESEVEVLACFSSEKPARNFAYYFNQQSRGIAALRAMRERTPAMIEAGPPEPYLHDEIWNHIIDAAINEGK